MLLAFDGSPAARSAIFEAGRLFRGERAIVVNAWQSAQGMASAGVLGMPADVAGQAARELDASTSKRASEVAAEGAELARAAGLDAEPQAVPAAGSGWATICRCARELEAVTVVVGSRGLSGVKSALLGSVSNGVVHHCSRPTLVVQAADETTGQGHVASSEPADEHAAGRALLCYDGSESGRSALEEAGAVLAGGDALVLTVWEWEEPTLVPDRLARATELGRDIREVAQMVAEELERGRREQADETAGEGAEVARAAGFAAEPRPWRTVAATGQRDTTTVWEAIVAAADEEEASVVVVGSRGRAALSSSLLGSVSSGVVHHCSRPVLVIPTVD